MGAESIIVPIILDPQQGLDSLKKLGSEAQKTNQFFSGGSSASSAFGNAMQSAAGGALELFEGMRLVEHMGKLVLESLMEAIFGSEKLASSTKMLSEIQKKAEEGTRAEVIGLQALYAVAKDTNNSYEQRSAAIDKINKQYPELHKNISLENIGTKETADAIQSVINNLVKKAQLQGVVSQVAELTNKLDAMRESYNKVGSSIIKNAIRGEMKEVQERIDTLTASAVKLQGETITSDKDYIDAQKKRADDAKKVHDKEIKEHEQYVDRIIQKGKQLAAEFKNIVIVPQFSATDSKKEQYDKALKFMNDFKNMNLKFKIPVTPEITMPPEEVKQQAFDFGSMFSQELSAYFKTSAPTDFTLLSAPKDYEKTKKDAAELLSLHKQQADMISGYLTPAFDNFINAVLTKQDALKAFFKGVADSIKQLIKQLIQAAIQAAVLSLVTGGAAKGGVSFAGAFKKIFGFADGGLVTGPVSALIGEGKTTNSNNPEVVTPLDKLKRFFTNISASNAGYGTGKNMGMAGSILNVPSSVRIWGSGRDIEGVLVLEKKSQSKTG